MNEYLTDVEPILDPIPAKLPDNFGEPVSVPFDGVIETSRYGYIIADINEMVEVAWYKGYYDGYVSGFFQKWELGTNPHKRRPLTFQEIQGLGIEVWL